MKTPKCPQCGSEMKLRNPRKNQSWNPFWGCSQFPECKGTREIDVISDLFDRVVGSYIRKNLYQSPHDDLSWGDYEERY